MVNARQAAPPAAGSDTESYVSVGEGFSDDGYSSAGNNSSDADEEDGNRLHGGPQGATSMMGAADVQRRVSELLAAVLGGPVPEPEAPLMAAGLDSLGAVELRNSLQVRTVVGNIVVPVH
jgi:hypothetical protein